MIYFAVINLVIGGGISIGTDVIGRGIHIDSYAHLAGVGCGLLFALPMVPRLGAPRTLFERRLRIAVIMTFTLLVLFGFYIAQLPQIARARRSAQASTLPHLCKNVPVSGSPAFQARSNSHFVMEADHETPRIS